MSLRSCRRPRALRSPSSSYAWDQLRVPAEPVVIVLDRSGRELDRWFGPFTSAGSFTPRDERAETTPRTRPAHSQ
ncbi:MAG: hypothetical protein AVDCRST_MAG17-710 [uncultured Solirubrobacterales bacterium]|uniref:Uncharacterized protein n=1 Tax=uncultured Solirubrobacterales bacterium TaxID=768556 RepID=A0A6J4SEQ3_9ACTN|nr:MAG: hypothetical protein AVDCRST_MAG17-710 [uncultured Solirubrobacterales bacterium]